MTHDNRARSCLHAHHVIGQDQDNRSIGTRPNQGREPPLFWSVEFMKEVIHVESTTLRRSCSLWWTEADFSSFAGSNRGVRKLMKARASAPLVVTNNKGKTQWFANYPSFAR